MTVDRNKPQIHGVTDKYGKSLRIINYAPEWLSVQILQILERMFLVNCANIRMPFSMELTITKFSVQPVYNGGVFTQLGDTPVCMTYGGMSNDITTIATHCIGHQIGALINLESDAELFQEMIERIIQEESSISEDIDYYSEKSDTIDQPRLGLTNNLMRGAPPLPRNFDPDEILKSCIEEDRKKKLKDEGKDS